MRSPRRRPSEAKIVGKPCLIVYKALEGKDAHTTKGKKETEILLHYLFVFDEAESTVPRPCATFC